VNFKNRPRMQHRRPRLCGTSRLNHQSLTAGRSSARAEVVAKFDESAVNFGDPKAPAPLNLSCSDAQATQGSGRWLSDREWAFEFARDLSPGIVGAR